MPGAWRPAPRGRWPAPQRAILREQHGDATVPGTAVPPLPAARPCPCPASQLAPQPSLQGHVEVTWRAGRWETQCPGPGCTRTPAVLRSPPGRGAGLAGVWTTPPRQPGKTRSTWAPGSCPGQAWSGNSGDQEEEPPRPPSPLPVIRGLPEAKIPATCGVPPRVRHRG